MAIGPSNRPKKLLERAALQQYAVKLLSGRMMSIGDLKQKLRAKAAFPDEDVGPVLSNLKQYGYLNDKTFADSFAVSRRDNQSLGAMRVLRDLRAKRVGSTVAEQAVREAFAGRDEEEMIETFLARKYRGVDLSRVLSDEKKLASAYRRLRMAGYSSANSIRVLKRYALMADDLENLEDNGGDAEPLV